MLLGTTPLDSIRRKPSEIPSKTRLVSAFLPGRASLGPRSTGNAGDQLPAIELVLWSDRVVDKPRALQ